MITQQTALVESRRGRMVALRPAETDDQPKLAAMLTHLSARTIYLRYLLPRPAIPPEEARDEARRLTSGVAEGRVALLGLLDAPGRGQAVALGELVPDRRTPGVAELALLVADDYQGEGIGAALGAHLLGWAACHGIATIRAFVLAQNAAIRRLIARLGAPYTATYDYGMTIYQIDVRGFAC